nr:MAG TPA: hypothetical protein [Caudoviricetes sp.]
MACHLSKAQQRKPCARKPCREVQGGVFPAPSRKGEQQPPMRARSFWARSRYHGGLFYG